MGYQKTSLPDWCRFIKLQFYDACLTNVKSGPGLGITWRNKNSRQQGIKPKSQAESDVRYCASLLLLYPVFFSGKIGIAE
jgi:hypothetical protein